MKNIILVGYMATGKSAVSKELSERLNMKYVSLDEEIERKEQMKIRDIFAKEGEKYFRAKEKEMLEEVCARKDQVIDTGGGAVLDKDNMRILLSSGVCICLWADAPTILNRTSGDKNRPLLNVKDPESRIRRMFEERTPYYRKAPFHVDTTDKDLDEVVEEVERIVENER